MIRLVLFCLLAAALVVLALWANQVPWRVVLERDNGNDFELTMTGAGLVIAILGAAAALMWAILGGLFRLPDRIRAVRQRVKKRKGNDALAAGLLAIEAGDVKNARKQAARALSDAEDERLALLLEARTAEEDEDWTRAERAYSELSRKAGAHQAALRGLTVAAVKRGDLTVAKQRAKEALDFKGEIGDWPFTSLFEIQVMQAEWADAKATVVIAEQRSFIEADPARRRKAVLATAQAMPLLHTDDTDTAEKLLQDAFRWAPAFTPAAVALAGLQMKAEKYKHALSTLEIAWRAYPHPALSLLARQLEDVTNGARKAVSVLSNTQPDHRETALLKIDVALAKSDWTGALELVKPLAEAQATSRICRLMEAIHKGLGDDASARDWAERAASAPREPEWSDIAPDGSSFTYTKEEWARLVYAYGDAAQLIHPRHEAYSADLDAIHHLALPAPSSEPVENETTIEAAGKVEMGPKAINPPTDYVDEP